MLTLEERKKLHNLIMHELAIKALQHDYDKLSQLRLSSLYERVTYLTLETIKKQLTQLKSELLHRKIRILSWQQQNEHFTQVEIATSADNLTLEYAKKAIESNVHDIIRNALPH